MVAFLVLDISCFVVLLFDMTLFELNNFKAHACMHTTLIYLHRQIH